MKSNLLSFALFILGALSLQAQDQNVSMEIDFVSWGEDLSGLEVRSGKEGGPVKALAFRYSEPIKYSGPAVIMLALTKDYEGAVDKGKLDSAETRSTTKSDQKENKKEIPEILRLAREKDPELAALVELPANSRRVTILLLPGPDRSLIARLFNDDPKLHPAGKVRVHNLSEYPISLGSSSGKVIGFKPGKSGILTSSGTALIYELSYQINGSWVVQENNITNILPTEQLHMVILRSGASFFTSRDGSSGGFMQVCFLRRRLE